MVRQHYWLNGHEFEQIPGDTGGQRSLAGCRLWGCRVRHHLTTQQQQHLHSCRSRIFWHTGTSHLWWESDLLPTVRNCKTYYPLLYPLLVGRAYLISAANDRKPNSNDLVPKGNLLSLVYGKLREVELTSDTAWCYKDTLLIQFCSLLCTSLVLT